MSLNFLRGFMLKVEHERCYLLCIKMYGSLLKKGVHLIFEKMVKMPHVIRRLQVSKVKNILDRYPSCLIARHYSPDTIRHHWFTMKCFFKWLTTRKIGKNIKNQQSPVNLFDNKHMSDFRISLLILGHKNDLRAVLNVLMKTCNPKYKTQKEKMPGKLLAFLEGL